ncbi:hypothetical protein P1A30_05915 [Staphylococcus equorum]|nr:hypothetical protein [Staphylococcus equorum]
MAYQKSICSKYIDCSIEELIDYLLDIRLRVLAIINHEILSDHFKV